MWHVHAHELLKKRHSNNLLHTRAHTLHVTFLSRRFTFAEVAAVDAVLPALVPHPHVRNLNDVKHAAESFEALQQALTEVSPKALKEMLEVWNHFCI